MLNQCTLTGNLGRDSVTIQRAEQLMACQSDENIKQLENQIRDLQKELAAIQKDQVVLRLQPCRGDSEIRGEGRKIR